MFATAGERKDKALHDTKEIHRKQPKREQRRVKSDGVSQATNERETNIVGLAIQLALPYKFSLRRQINYLAIL